MKIPKSNTTADPKKREKTEGGYILGGKEYRTKFSCSDELCEYMSGLTGSKTILAFSMGKDSLVSFIILKKYFAEILPVYFYRFPGEIEFIEKQLEYYEDFFSERIYTFPHPHLYMYLTNGVCQSYEGMMYLRDCDIRPKSFSDWWGIIRESDVGMEEAFAANGMRAADSPNRLLAMRNHGVINYTQKTFYPIYDYKKDKLVNVLRNSGIKLPCDYRFGSNSIDGLDAKYLSWVRVQFPEDYERITCVFPLAPMDEARYAFRNRYWKENRREA